MFIESRIVTHRWLALPLFLLLTTACDDGAATRVEAPDDASFTHLTDKPSGNAVLEVTVQKADRSPAIGSIVTVVALPKPGVPDEEWVHWGPIQHKEVPASGVVNFTNLPDGAKACVHVRSDIALSTAKNVALYPAPLGTLIDPPNGDPTQAAVLTGHNRQAVRFTPEDYVKFCIDNPPLTLAAQGGHTKITLRHTLATSVDVKVFDLLGQIRGDVQRGVVTGGFIGNAQQPIFSCAQVPWLKNDPLCDNKETPPGFLHSTRDTPAALSVAQGVPFRVEALGQVSVGDNLVELVATKGYTGGAVSEVLVGENLVCVGGSDPKDHIEDEIGNASAMDIQGLIKFSIGVNYGIGLTPDQSRTTVWFDMTADNGTVSYSSRTVPVNTNQTRNFSMDFSARHVDGKYVCTAGPSSGQLANLGASAVVFCDTASAPPGLVRVTVITRGITPWTSHEFSIRTNPDQGSGDSTWDPARSGASRAFVPITNHDKCTVQGGNDDRLAVRF